MLNIYKIIVTLFLILFFSFERIGAKEYKGAELRTHQAFTYGRFEVRFKPANRPGMLSSFFTYHEISDISEWNEIDIEILGRYKNNVQFNTITGGQINHASSRYVNINPFADFNVYAIEWTPSYIAWFVNGEEIYRQTGTHVQTVNRPQKLMMNIWNPIYEDWVGEWSDDFLPAFAYYDWVAYYEYTPGSGDQGTNNNFTLKWRDEFDSYNSDRWGKGTHTWNGNQSDFVPENVVFKDGLMILCLTDSDNRGYQDIAPPKVLWAVENFENDVLVKFSEEVDEISAETASNYIIPGVTVVDAILSEDKTEAVLKTENYNQDLSYNLIFQNITDDAETPNMISTSAVTVSQFVEPQYPLKINIGGESFDDHLAGQPWSENSLFGNLDGAVSTVPGNTNITNTDTPQLYHTGRYKIVTYKIRVPNGVYNLKLKTAETYYNELGKRIFDIIVEGEKVVDDLDIYAEVGKNAAYVIETQVTVNDGIIDIYLPAEIDNSTLNGIELDQISTSINNSSTLTPHTFELYQNYPNPFNNGTKIRFILHERCNVVLHIYNLLGEKVYSSNLGILNKGSNEIQWKPSAKINSGVYFYQISLNRSNTHVMKLIYLK